MANIPNFKLPTFYQGECSPLCTYLRVHESSCISHSNPLPFRENFIITECCLFHAKIFNYRTCGACRERFGTEGSKFIGEN